MVPFNYFDESAAMDLDDLWYGTQGESASLPERAPLVQKFLKGGACAPKYEEQNIIGFINSATEFD